MHSLRFSIFPLLGLATLTAVLASCGSRGAAPPPQPVVNGSVSRAGGGAEEDAPSHTGVFSKVMDLPVTANLWHLGSESLVLGGARGPFALIHGDKIHGLPELDRGLDLDDGTYDRGSTHRILGRWPDAVWLVWRGHDTWSAAHNMWFERLFRLRTDRWELIHETEHDESSNELYRGLWEQPRGCLVGLLSDNDDSSDASWAHQEVFDCPAQSAPDFPFVATKQREYGIAAVLGFASGEVLVLEHHTEMTEGDPIPVRLAISRPGKPNRTEIDLPLPAEIARDRRGFWLDNCRLLGQKPTDVHVILNYMVSRVPGRAHYEGVITHPVILRFNGASFSPIPLPQLDFFMTADLAEDGTLVALGSPAKDPGERVTWALPDGGEWIPIRMPLVPEVEDVYRPWSIAAHSIRDIWVVGYHEKEGGKDRRSALFHKRPAAGAVTTPHPPR